MPAKKNDNKEDPLDVLDVGSLIVFWGRDYRLLWQCLLGVVYVSKVIIEHLLVNGSK